MRIFCKSRLNEAIESSHSSWWVVRISSKSSSALRPLLLSLGPNALLLQGDLASDVVASNNPLDVSRRVDVEYANRNIFFHAE